MEQTRLLSIFFLLGKSSKDWEFLEDDWEDEYEDTTGLSWENFELLHRQDWWSYHSNMNDLFQESFSKTREFRKVKKVFEAISADSEDWNDFLDLILTEGDFDEIWNTSWLTKNDMESTLQEFIESEKKSASSIIKLRRVLNEWFLSDGRSEFRDDLIRTLGPLEIAIESLQI